MRYAIIIIIIILKQNWLFSINKNSFEVPRTIKRRKKINKSINKRKSKSQRPTYWCAVIIPMRAGFWDKPFFMALPDFEQNVNAHSFTCDQNYLYIFKDFRHNKVMIILKFWTIFVKKGKFLEFFSSQNHRILWSVKCLWKHVITNDFAFMILLDNASQYVVNYNPDIDLVFIHSDTDRCYCLGLDGDHMATHL